MQLGPRVYTARAETTSGEERARLWAMIIAKAPTFADYEKKAGGREIPVIRLSIRPAPPRADVPCRAPPTGSGWLPCRALFLLPRDTVRH